MNRIRIILIFSVLTLLFVGTGCSSKKKMTKTTLREFTASRLIKEVQENEFDFDNFQAKMNLKIETADKSFSTKGQLRMQKDSIIWTSISAPLGVEVLRMMVTSTMVVSIATISAMVNTSFGQANATIITTSISTTERLVNSFVK